MRAPSQQKAFNWDDLRVFLAVGRQGTLTRAARFLGVTHTTVSRRLRALEAGVGARLFERLPAGYVPTDAGHELMEVSERVEAEMLALESRVLGHDARLSGTIRVTTIDTIAMHHAEMFEQFNRRYPGVTVELSVDNALVSLTKREADVAIRVTNSPQEHLVGRRIGRFEMAVYAARSLVERLGPSATLDAYPWVRWDVRLGARMTEAWIREHVPKARVACYVDTGSVMLSVIRAGLGAAHLSCYYGDSDPELVRLRDVEPDFGMDFWVLTHPDLRNTARVKAFIDHVATWMKPHQALMAGDQPGGAALTQ